jgi:hypothetical protein
LFSNNSYALNVNGSDESVAKVIWCEGVGTTYRERFLIASVMKNRLKHKGFSKGNLTTLREVCYAKNAFSCVNSKKNKQWTLTHDSNFWVKNKQWKDIWIQCLVLSRGTFVPRTQATFYHDKSILIPSSWRNNQYYDFVLVEETPNFCFYKITSKG